MATDITGADYRAMLNGALRMLPRECVRWRDEESVRADLGSELDEQVRLCSDLRFAGGYAESIGIGRPEDYLARFVRVGDARVLCGIRFYGGDKGRPFIDLIASTSPDIDWGEASRAGVQAFAVFKPRAARLFCAGPAPAGAGSGVAAIGDQVVVAECCAVLCSTARQETGVTLRDADPDEAAGFVERNYCAFGARRPELAPKVFASDREELASCRDGGRLAWWLVDGEVAGVIAVRREKAFGLDGFLMVEEVVGEKFAGRGTAAQAQREMARWCLERDPASVLFGTVDCANAPSRRAAERAGRREIAGWWFLADGGVGWPWCGAAVC